MTARTRRLGYRRELDGVRGIAIALVVLYHAYGWPKGGFLGVDLFFVLSGFLITTLLLEEHAARGTVSLRNFYLRRALRLLPALVALLACYVLYTVARLAVNGDLSAGTLAHPLEAVAGGLFYFTNIVEAFGSQPDVALGHLWSLSQEEQFYIVWPPLLVFVLRARPRLAVGALVALTVAVVVHRYQLAAAHANLHRLMYGPDARTDSILVGCLAGVLFASDAIPERVRSSRLLAPAALLALVPIVLPARALGYALYRDGLETVLAVAFALAIGAAVLGPPRGLAWLRTPPLVFLGKISYALYLWHLPLLFATHAISRGGARDGVVLPAVAIAASVAAATLSYRLVERPFLRRKDALHGGGARRADQPSAASAGAAISPIPAEP